MNNTANLILAFTLGAATGSLVAWRVLKTKYEQIAQNEIDSYKEHIRSRSTHVTPKEEVEVEEKEKPDELNSILDNYVSTDVRREDKKEVSKPYVITSEEYDDHEDDYECLSLTYYKDGVLTDEWDTVIKNVDEIVGDDALALFETCEEDSIYVRNDELKCDYEILRDTQTFAEAMGGYYEPSEAED